MFKLNLKRNRTSKEPIKMRYNVDTSFKQVEPYSISGVESIRQAPEKEPMFGFIGKAAQAAFNVAKNTIEGASTKIVNLINVMDNRGKNLEIYSKAPGFSYYNDNGTKNKNYENEKQKREEYFSNAPDITTLEKVSKAGQAAVGVANIGFLPITTQMEAGKEVPILKYPVGAASYVFENLGQLGTKTMDEALNIMPISEQSKNTVRPLLDELGAFTVQIVGAKFIHDISSKGIKSKIIPENISNNIQKTSRLATQISVTPFSTAFGISTGILRDKIEAKKTKEITSKEAVDILKEVKEELPKQIKKIVIEDIKPRKGENILNLLRTEPTRKVQDIVPIKREKPAERIKQIIRNEIEPTKEVERPKPVEILKELEGIQKAQVEGKSFEEYVKNHFANLEKPEYGMSHRPSYEDMPPAYNLLKTDTLPKDVYSHPEWSISNSRTIGKDKSATESWDALQKIKGKPNADVYIYRSSPHKGLRTGDWVSFSKNYAKEEGIHPTDATKDLPVFKYKVKAKDVIFAGDDINEFGYYPESQLKELWDKTTKVTQTVKTTVKPLDLSKGRPTVEPTTKKSKIGKSIEQKAIEAGLTKKFKNTAEFETINIKDQAKRANEVMKDIESAREIIRGEKPLPEKLNGVALIEAMGQYIEKNPNADLAYELANSPIISGTSVAAQTLRLAAEREPDSITAKLQRIKDSRKKDSEKLTKKTKKELISDVKKEVNKNNLSKEDLSWNKFLDKITC